jgi:hypothetical protein
LGSKNHLLSRHGTLCHSIRSNHLACRPMPFPKSLISPTCHQSTLRSIIISFIDNLISHFLDSQSTYVFFLRFFSFTPNEAQARADRYREFRIATYIFISIFLIAVALSILAGVLYYNLGVASSHMTSYAKVCGVISSIVILFQWLPQIYTIFRLKVKRL